MINHYQFVKHRSRVFVPALALLFVLPQVLKAQLYYTDGHGDLGVEYTAGETEFEAHWHLGAGAVLDGNALVDEEEYEPGAVVARLSTTVAAPSAVAPALGVSSGSTVWRTGSAAYPPNLGFALEEVGSDTDWEDGAITLTLTGWSGPGEVAISQTVIGLGTFVWFSTYDEDVTVAENSWAFGVGGHQHLDWFFTEVGNYEMTFEWSGTYIGGESPLAVTGSGTFGIQVVPEPSTYAMIVLGAGALVLFRKRCRA